MPHKKKSFPLSLYPETAAEIKRLCKARDERPATFLDRAIAREIKRMGKGESKT